MEWQSYFLPGMEFLFLGLGSWFDVRNQRIPVSFLMIFGILGVAGNMIVQYQHFSDILPGVGIGLMFLWIGWITKEAIGYADGFGMIVLAIFAGWRRMLPVVCGGFLLSGFYGIYRMICSKGDYEDTMPFFPFLLLALMGMVFL